METRPRTYENRKNNERRPKSICIETVKNTK